MNKSKQEEVFPRYVIINILKHFYYKKNYKGYGKFINSLSLVCKEWNEIVVPLIKTNIYTIYDHTTYTKYSLAKNDKGFRFRLILNDSSEEVYLKDINASFDSMIDTLQYSLPHPIKLRSFPSLRELQLKLDIGCNEILNQIKCTSLSTMILELTHIGKASNIELGKITNLFKFSTTVKELDIIGGITPSGMISIVDIDSLTRFTSLETLHLDGFKINVNLLNILLTRTKTLKTLSLRSLEYYGGAFSEILECIPNCESLQSLILVEFTMNLDMLVKCVNSTKSLKSLKVTTNTTVSSVSPFKWIDNLSLEHVDVNCCGDTNGFLQLWNLNESKLKSVRYDLCSHLYDNSKAYNVHELISTVNRCHSTIKKLYIQLHHPEQLIKFYENLRLPNLKTLEVKILDEPYVAIPIIPLLKSLPTIKTIKIYGMIMNFTYILDLMKSCQTIEKVHVEKVNSVDMNKLCKVLIKYPGSIRYFSISGVKSEMKSFNTYIEEISKIILNNQNIQYIRIPSPSWSKKDPIEKLSGFVLFLKALEMKSANLNGVVISGCAEISKLLEKHLLTKFWV
ncbi:hypothetical protein DLAC_05198 [Tieghemostelium lacteum]|uniref:F-box domain-containing protein n=1 Tax=Tieghemostelium lacteum TaxID=361077 RepID=A0A151ZIL1_TIELA|nr:hypothetical protein DLAC_05198 [Tieghemostelium lacteum]|eukprot:KYQ93803.1 hypothetical protein DLAC_05198 [Tieghemostelium lacteum]